MKNLRSILYFLLVLLITACQDDVTGPDLRTRNLEDFNAAWNRVDAVYPFLEFKQIDWDTIYTEYLPRVEAAEGSEFIDILDELLAELKDNHVFFITIFGEVRAPWYSPRLIRDKDAFSMEVVRTYFDDGLLSSSQGTIQYRVSADSVGYIYLANLENNDIGSEFPSVIAGMNHTKGLVLDLRANNGGSITNIVAVISRFLDSPLPWPGYFFLGEPLPLDPVQPQGPFTYSEPVVVLINGTMISAAETLSEMLKHLPQVTAVGDTTSGGGGGASDHTPQAEGHYYLPGGTMINIPTGYGLRYDGQHIEWNGVPPDIRIAQTAADIQGGVDKQLEKALELMK